MKNKLSDLNDHLFATIERLNDEDIEGEKLDEEIRRASAITNVSGQIIANANLVLQAAKFRTNEGFSGKDLPGLLGGSEE